MEMAAVQAASTREGTVFGADGCIRGKILLALSSWENKGKYKDRQDWNRTREIICTNTVVIGVSVMVSVRLRCKERWWFPTD